MQSSPMRSGLQVFVAPFDRISSHDHASLKKIGSLKKATMFEMNNYQYIITKSGHGYPDGLFISPGNTNEVFTTINKENMVEVINDKPGS